MTPSFPKLIAPRSQGTSHHHHHRPSLSIFPLPIIPREISRGGSHFHPDGFRPLSLSLKNLTFIITWSRPPYEGTSLKEYGAHIARKQPSDSSGKRIWLFNIVVLGFTTKVKAGMARKDSCTVEEWMDNKGKHNNRVQKTKKLSKELLPGW